MVLFKLDEHLLTQPEEVQIILKRIWKIVDEVAAAMGYGVPAAYLNGKPLIYSSGFKNTLAFIPQPRRS